MLTSANESGPMTWQVNYSLDFGFCFNYPKEYWFGYFDTLREYGYNVVWLWVAGVMPTPGYESTLAWRCEYVPEVVDYLHRKGMRVHLMSGVFGWLGMSPGLIRMHPEMETTWPEDLKRVYPLESTRRGLCPTRSFDLCLDYVESLYRACPQADGLCLEVYCEKPHCQCEACTSRGLWRLELDFLRRISERVWKWNPSAEFIWPFGYGRTHGEGPEARLYPEILKMDDPRYIWWQVRMKDHYVDEAGNRHEWMDPKELAAYGPRLLCLTHSPETCEAAHQAGALGTVPADPAGRYMFLPDYDPIHFGYFVESPAPNPTTYDHVLFHLRAFRRQMQGQSARWDAEAFRRAVAERFFGDAGADGERLARYLLLLEDLVLDKRVCLYRSAARIWGDIDGGESAKVGKFTREYSGDIRAIASLPETNRWTGQMRRTAGAMMGLAEESSP